MSSTVAESVVKILQSEPDHKNQADKFVFFTPFASIIYLRCDYAFRLRALLDGLLQGGRSDSDIVADVNKFSEIGSSFAFDSYCLIESIVLF